MEYDEARRVGDVEDSEVELRRAESDGGGGRGQGRAGGGAGQRGRAGLVRHALLHQLGQRARCVHGGRFMFTGILTNILGKL